MTYETPWFDTGMPEVKKIPLYYTCPLCPFTCKDPTLVQLHAKEHNEMRARCRPERSDP